VAVAEAAKPDLAAVRAEYESWSRAHKRPKTVLNDTKRLAEFFASVPGKGLGEIATVDLERFLSKKAHAGCAPATRLRHREILHAFFQFALRLGYVDRNPVSAVARPRLPEPEPRFLGSEEIEALLRAVEGDAIAPVVAVAIFAGLRREELCWLCRDDVVLDQATPVLRVRAKTVAGESWMPKTRRNRVVPISGRLRAALEAHLTLARPRGAGPWLFLTPEGCRWDPDNLSRRMREAQASAGLAWNFLELRHTFGSQLAKKGVSLLKIAKLMGNSPAIASRHYINLVPEEMAVDVEF
jgi:integrase